MLRHYGDELAAGNGSSNGDSNGVQK
jgi:hypothetical protein